MSHSGGSGGQGGHGGHQGAQGHGFGDFSNADILGSDVENISWSTLFQGLTVNTGVRFFIVFTTFIAWLYVIYWIRHHEPFSNQVIGMTAPHSPTAEADRSLLGGVYKVFPFKTPALASGSFYVPTPGVAEASGPSDNTLGIYSKSFGEALQQKTVIIGTPKRITSTRLIDPREQQFDQQFGSPVRP